MLGVSVGKERHAQQIGLSGARGHARGWPGPLHIKDDAGNFGVITQSCKLRH